MLKILFSANKAVTKSSDVEHSYSWLSEGVRNSMCSEPQLWHHICSSTNYSFCQAHTSPSAYHDPATHWHRNSSVSAGSDHRSLPGLFPAPIYTFGRWGNQTLHILQNTGQIQRKSKKQTVSFTCVVSNSIHISVLNIKHTFLKNWSFTLFLIFRHSLSPAGNSMPHSSSLSPAPRKLGRRIRKKK